MKTIFEVYDITQAILTNKFIGIQNTSNAYNTSYRIESAHPAYGTLVLIIEAPHGAPEWNMSDELWLEREGIIELYHNKRYLFSAYTKHNVGRAFDRSKYNPISIFTRARAPLFFHLLNMAHDRLHDRVEKTNNTQQIAQLLKTLTPTKQK